LTYLSVMKRVLASPRSKPLAQNLKASEILSDYEQWLLSHYGSIGTYKDHAKSFLRRFRDQGSLLNQLDTFASRKSITGRSILNRFRKFLEEKNIGSAHNDLKPSRSDVLPLSNVLVKLYLVYNMDRLRSKRSRSTYATILNNYFSFIGSIKHFEKITAQRFVFAKGRSEFTSALYATVLKSFARWVLTYLITPDDELSVNEQKIKGALGEVSIRSLRDVAGIKASASLRKLYYKESLSKRQRDRLLSQCSLSRERAIIVLMAYEGLRPVEVERLSVNDFGFRKSTVAVWGKGRSARHKETIALFSIVSRHVRTYLKENKIKKGKVFPDLNYKNLHEFIRHLFSHAKLRVKKLSPHSLRHTAGQLLYDEGVPLEFIQRTLRHTSMQSTLVYARKAIEKSYFKQMKKVW
jgi:integrase/recombinase XerC